MGNFRDLIFTRLRMIIFTSMFITVCRSHFFSLGMCFSFFISFFHSHLSLFQCGNSFVMKKGMLLFFSFGIILTKPHILIVMTKRLLTLLNIHTVPFQSISHSFGFLLSILTKSLGS